MYPTAVALSQPAPNTSKSTGSDADLVCAIAGAAWNKYSALSSSARSPNVRLMRIANRSPQFPDWLINIQYTTDKGRILPSFSRCETEWKGPKLGDTVEDTEEECVGPGSGEGGRCRRFAHPRPKPAGAGFKPAPTQFATFPRRRATTHHPAAPSRSHS